MLNVVCAGLGRIGAQHAFNIAHRTPNAKLLAVFDPDESKQKWAQDNLPKDVVFTTSYTELLAIKGAQLVWIATPTPFHAEQMIAAMDCDLNVFCEKPISLDIDKAQAVVDHWRTRKPHLYVTIGFIRRFDSRYQLAAEQLKKGAIGRPLVLQTQSCDPRDHTGHFVNQYAPVSGGIFVDCAIHDIDLTLWLFGDHAQKVKKVFATGSSTVLPKLKEYGDCDNVIGVVEFESGALAQYYCSRTSSSGQLLSTQLIGDKGRLTLRPEAPTAQLSLSDSVSIAREASEERPNYYDLNGTAMLSEPETIVREILNGSKPAFGLEDSVRGLQIGLALQQSLREGRHIEL